MCEYFKIEQSASNKCFIGPRYYKSNPPTPRNMFFFRINSLKLGGSGYSPLSLQASL